MPRMAPWLLVAAWLLPAAAALAAPIDEWRQRATAIRKLADNDAPAAYEQAQRLQAELPPDARADDRIRALNLLARVEIHLSKTSQALEHAEQALREATAARDRAGQAEAEMNIGLGAVNRNDVGRLVEVTEQTIAALEGVDRPDLLGEALFRGALVYRRVSRLEDAATMSLQALDAAQRSGDPLVMAYAHHGLAISYLQSGRRVEGEQQANQMLRQARAAGSRLQQGYAELVLFEVATQRADLDQASSHLDLAIGLFTAVGSPTALSTALTHRTETALKRGRLQEALAANEQVRELLKTTQLRAGFFFNALQRSQIEQRLGHRAQALAEAQDARERSRSLGQPLYESFAARRLAELAAAAGDNERAYRLATEAADLMAKATTERSAERLIEAAQRRRDEARRQELAELQRRGEQQAAELRERESQQRWLWTVLAGSLVALTGTVLFVLRLRRSRAEVRNLAGTLEIRVRERTEQLEGAQRAAEAATRAKSEFLANMSHEIRTPMNAILGMSYLALQGPLEARQRNYVEKVHGAAESLLRIINDILDFSKIEAGKLEIESADFALGDVLDQLANLLGVAAEEKGLQLLFELPPDLPTALVGDASRLGQILLNLGNNALKFTERGRVTVAVALVERTPERATLRFEVRDTGIGMTAQACERLFQPFTQADASTSRRYGGTGLGLAICRHLVERMGGTIGVDSQPGQGSSFHFTLPFGLQPQGSPAAPSGGRQDARQNPRAGLAGTRVLLVEDNVLNQELACDLLEGAGIEVAVAADGRQALDALERERYDAVLMDCQMPVMDGYEATRALRQRAELKDLPVIAMTANAMAGDREKVIAAGMNDHVAKPIHVDELFAALARWVVRSGERSVDVQRAADRES